MSKINTIAARLATAQAKVASLITTLQALTSDVAPVAAKTARVPRAAKADVEQTPAERRAARKAAREAAAAPAVKKARKTVEVAEPEVKVRKTRTAKAEVAEPVKVRKAKAAPVPEVKTRKAKVVVQATPAKKVRKAAADDFLDA